MQAEATRDGQASATQVQPTRTNAVKSARQNSFRYIDRRYHQISHLLPHLSTE